MTFTEEQLKTLSTWEDNFRCAVKADWARNPGSTNLKVIYDIYTSATGDPRRFVDNCQHCIVSLLRDCGRIYFRDTEELATRKSSTGEVKVSQEAKQVVKHARIITPKTYKKKK